MEMNQYLELFIEESREHLQNVNDVLLQLEKSPENLALVNEIFRSAHTLKGMSATMGYEDLANLTHKMENVLDAIRNEKIPVTSEVMDRLIESVEALEIMVEAIAGGGTGAHNVSTLVAALQMIESGEQMPAPKPQIVEEIASADTFTEFELHAIQQGANDGFNCLHFTISLREDCVLKAARVYMCMEIFNNYGTVMKTVPETEALESESFEYAFDVYLLTHEHTESIVSQLERVSEVHTVTVSSVEIGEVTVNPTEAAVQQQETVTAQPSPVVAKEAQQQAQTPIVQQQSKTIRVNLERLDILMNLFEELVIDRGRLEQIAHELQHNELNETVERMSRVSGDLQNIILNMRMVPVETVFNRFPRMVRQLAKDLGKQIDLVIEGADTELDRTVIDEIGDPLVHLIRNAIDHGIEKPAIREANGKAPVGTVTLHAYHSGNHVFIDIRDDGAGISKERVLKKALDRGVITENMVYTLSDKQIYELIFASGFSTADTISDISGRGVGLDVVKNTIESLGGSVSIDAEEGKGTIFSVQLPLTLSIISVMLVEIQAEKYAIPLNSIIETAMIPKASVFTTHGKQVIDFRGKIIPLVFLKDRFNVPNTLAESDEHAVLIVRKGERLAALVVDTFVGQQEIVLKSLGSFLPNVPAISGATILGDGEVALIVDCNALIK
ncbi:MAG: chemotaxis protein CheW [Bacilli bacterium]